MAQRPERHELFFSCFCQKSGESLYLQALARGPRELGQALAGFCGGGLGQLQQQSPGPEDSKLQPWGGAAGENPGKYGIAS